MSLIPAIRQQFSVLSHGRWAEAGQYSLEDMDTSPLRDPQNGLFRMDI